MDLRHGCGHAEARGLPRAGGDGPPNALAIGLSGAATVVALDNAVTRARALQRCPILRAAARIGIALAGASVPRRVGSPPAVADGMVAGAVLVSALDLGISVIARTRGT